MATHRGTPRQTNNALHTEQLMLGGDKGLMLINIFFWTWIAFGFGVSVWLLACVVGFTICFMGLRYAAKSDPKYTPTCRRNSTFILQGAYYATRGSAHFTLKQRKVKSIAFNTVSRTPKGG